MISGDNLVCIYHHPCYDGFTASWVVDRLLDGPIAFCGANHGQPVPDFEEGMDVLMVDISWDRETMLEVAEKADEILVLDHHQTAEEELEGLDFAIFDMERSGAGLAWDFLSIGHPRPKLVDHVEDRDLWRFEIQGTKQVHAYLSSLPWDRRSWGDTHDALEEDPDFVYDAGRHIRRFQERRYEDVAKQFHLVSVTEDIGALTLPAANVSLANFKSGGIHEFLDQNPWCQVAATYGRGRDGRWYWSLRSREGFDCSGIARRYGGGGHAQSAGFVNEEAPVYQGKLND